MISPNLREKGGKGMRKGRGKMDVKIRSRTVKVREGRDIELVKILCTDSSCKLQINIYAQNKTTQHNTAHDMT